jgi:hypothetical protein
VSSTASCPECRSSQNVTYGGREGGTGQSKDVWQCSTHGKFTTPAR